MFFFLIVSVFLLTLLIFQVECGDEKPPASTKKKNKIMIPFQLVKPTKDHNGLELVQEGVDYLMSIAKNVAIVSFVGPYHSGKSFLSNALVSLWRAKIAHAKEDFMKENIDLFQVAEQVAPTTMGIWLLQTDIELPDGSVVLFMDTEGFYGQDVSESYDARTFTVATLLSSYLVYNTIKLIDQGMVEYLEILARRTQVFQIKNIIRTAGNKDLQEAETMSQMVDHVHKERDSNHNVLQYNDFPYLSVAVRDFASNLQGMTPDQWFNKYIVSHRDQTSKTRQNNRRNVPDGPQS